MSTNKQPSQAQMKDKIVAVREGIKEIFADKTKQFSNDNIIIVLDHFENNVKSTIEAFLDGQADALLTEWKKAPNKTKSKKKKKNSKKKAAAADVSLNDTASSDIHGKHNGVAASPHAPEVKSTESSRERSRVEKQTKPAEVNGPVARAPARMEFKNETNKISNKNHTTNAKSGSQPSPHLGVAPKVSQDVTKKPVADHQSSNKIEKAKKNLYQTKPVSSDVPPKTDVSPPAEPAPSVNNYHNKVTANGSAATTVTVSTTSTPTALTKKLDKSSESPKPPTTFHPSPVKSVQKPANQSKQNSSSNHNNQKPMPKKKSAPKSSNGKGPQHQNPTHPVKSNENDSAVALANKKIIEKSARDLLRCQVSLSRYQTVVHDDSEASYKDVKQSFQELNNLVMDREVDLMRKIDQSKATALEFISKRQTIAVQLKVRTERVGQMTPGEVNELRAEIKHFVSERKHDEQVSKTSRFTLNIDVLKKEIQQFGEAPQMRKPREHVSSVIESTTPTPSVTTPAVVNLEAKTPVENDVLKPVGAVPAMKIDAPRPASNVQPDHQTVPNSTNNKQVTNESAPSPTVGGSQDVSPAESETKTLLPEKESPVFSPNEPVTSIKDENQVPSIPKIEEKPSQTVPSAVSPKKRRSPKGRPKDLSIQDAKGGRGMENGAVPDWADETDPTPIPSSPASWASDGPAPLSADISSFPAKVISNEMNAAGNNQFSRNFDRRSGSNHHRNRQNSNQSGSGQQNALKQDSELMPPPKHPDSNKYNRSRSGMRDHHQMRERSSRERQSRERSSRERPIAPADGGYRVGVNGPAAGDAPDFQPREQHRSNYRNRDAYRGSRGRGNSYRGRGNRGNNYRGRGGGANYNGPPHNNNGGGGGGYYRNHSGSRNGAGGNGGGNNDNYRMNPRRYNNNNPINGDHRPQNNNQRYEKGGGSNNKKVEPATAPVPAQE